MANLVFSFVLLLLLAVLTGPTTAPRTGRVLLLALPPLPERPRRSGGRLFLGAMRLA